MGNGHSIQEWSNIVNARRTYGYDYVISIEHEDPIMSIEEGFHTAVKNLKQVNIIEQTATM
ncbi:sugar phosphate isomerase/epimerase [Virgibacillus halotolerans]|nr:sugar phosphate isomerase/epimerase [Virgibacillus halotolerans]